MDPIDTYMTSVRAALADTELIAAIERGAVQLREQGYSVIPNVLSRDLCDAYHDQFWTILNKASNGRLSRPHCAEDLEDFKVTGNWPRNIHGIIEHGSFSHLPFMHEIRRNPRVQLPYALFYGEGSKFTSSVDRMNYQPVLEWMSRRSLKKAANQANIGLVDEAAWIHKDQSAMKQGLHCIQGLVTLEDCDQDGDASLELIPGSHLLHDQFEEYTSEEFKDYSFDPPKVDMQKKKMDWYKFPDDVKDNIQQTTELFSTFKSIKALKGSLILWDSRAWHQGGRVRAHKNKPRPMPRPRFVVYTCFQPNLIPGALSLPSNELVKREKIFVEHRGASHWPLSSTVFGDPQTYGKPQPEFDFSPFLTPRDQLDSVQKHMYGLAYDSRIDILDGQVREPLLDFAPESGVNKHYPPTLAVVAPPAKKKRPTEGTLDRNKRPVKRARNNVIVID